MPREAAQDSKKMSEEDGAPVMADDESKVSPELQVLRCVMQLDKGSFDTCGDAVESLRAAVVALCAPGRVPRETRDGCLADMLRLLAGLFKLRGGGLQQLVQSNGACSLWPEVLGAARAWEELRQCLCSLLTSSHYVLQERLCAPLLKATHMALAAASCTNPCCAFKRFARSMRLRTLVCSSPLRRS